jgi:hypothetical protein
MTMRVVDAQIPGEGIDILRDVLGYGHGERGEEKGQAGSLLCVPKLHRLSPGRAWMM